MSARKVAPAIEAVLGWPPPYDKLGIVAAKVSIQAEDELRALRSVVYAAERYAKDTEGEDGDNYGICRALARLRRSGGKGRGAR